MDASDFDRGSLRITSHARPGKLFTANEQLIVAEVGLLKAESLKRITDAVAALLDGSP